MQRLVALLSSIPDVVWSGVIASVLTLSGVLLSNWSNTRRLRLQLHHDSSEKSKERTAVLRRDVYLRVVEELTSVSTYLPSLPRLDVTKSNPADGVRGFLSAAAKLQLVAEPKTALLVNQLVAEYGELFLKILADVMPLQDLQMGIRIHGDMYEEAKAETKRILGEMAKFNETARTDKAVFDALNRALDFSQSRMNEYATKRDQLWAKFNHLNISFSRSVLSEMKRLGKLQNSALVEIRRDLGLTAELDAFEAQMQANWERMERQLTSTIARLQAQEEEEAQRK